MSLNEWQAVGVIAGAILAVVAVLKLAGKVMRRMFRLIRNASQFFEQVLGDKESGKPSMMEVLSDTRSVLHAQRNELEVIKMDIDSIKQVQETHVDQYHGGGPVPIRRPRR